MTDLLPHRDGQADTATINFGSFIGNWYSPAAVARLIEDSREEQQDVIDLKDACIKGMDEQMAMMSAEIDRLESQLDNITCIVAKMREYMNECKKYSIDENGLWEESQIDVPFNDVKQLIVDIEWALKAKENK